MNSACNDAFVPLTAAAPSGNPRPGFSVTVLAREETAQPFRSLVQSLKPLPGSHNSNCEPRVTVQRDGDRVSAIQIQCACGQIIELACVYDAAPAPSTPHAANSATVPETFTGDPAKTFSEPG
jgi:hypothetical protein